MVVPAWKSVKMEAVMVGRVAEQVVPSGPNTTMGADFFFPSLLLLLLLLALLLSPPGKFFLPHPPWSPIFLAPSAPRWHLARSLLRYSNSDEEGGVDDGAHRTDEKEDENIQAWGTAAAF